MTVQPPKGLMSERRTSRRGNRETNFLSASQHEESLRRRFQKAETNLNKFLEKVLGLISRESRRIGRIFGLVLLDGKRKEGK